MGTTGAIHLLPDPCTPQSGEQVGTTGPIHLLPDPCTPQNKSGAYRLFLNKTILFTL